MACYCMWCKYLRFDGKKFNTDICANKKYCKLAADAFHEQTVSEIRADMYANAQREKLALEHLGSLYEQISDVQATIKQKRVR